MTYQTFFQSHIQKFRGIMNGQAAGLCPFHEDRNPSFSVNLETGLWNCKGCGEKGNAFQFAQKLGVEIPEDFKDDRQVLGAEVCRYEYRDETGHLLYHIIRYHPKTFRALRPDGRTSLNGCRRVLYNLPEVLKSPYAYIVEGERDAESLRKVRIVATTNAFGAGSWKPDYAQSLTGKMIAVLPDQDDAGRKHCATVVKSLWGIAKQLKVVNPPRGKDVTEFLESGGDPEELRRIVRETPVLTEAEVARLSREIEVSGKSPKVKSAETGHAAMVLCSLRDLLAEPDEQYSYLVEGLLPTGGLSLLSAKPKTGKSTLARQVAFAVARGEEFLGRKTERGLAIYLALEERRADVKSHFLKMGASDEEDLLIFAGMAPADGLAQIRKIAEERKPSLIIVDTLARLARIKDMNDYSQATSGLEPFLALSREVGSHVLLLHHAKKGDGKGIDSVLGSTGIAGTVDTIINLHRNEDYRTISSIQRDGNDIPETVLQFDAETRMTTLGGSKEQTEIEELKGNIMKFLADQGEAVPEKAVDESVEGKRSYRKKALRKLVEEGKIRRSEKGAKGAPYLYSGILVPTISSEPEYQHPENGVTIQKSMDNSGSPKLALFDSNSQGQQAPVEAPEQEIVDDI